jgi:hypothetical protein
MANPSKTYYHNVPNSRYIAKDGTEHIFVGGQFTTDDPAVQADLDKQIANGNSVIRDKARATVDVAALTAKTAVDKQAEAAAMAAALQLKNAAPAVQ